MMKPNILKRINELSDIYKLDYFEYENTYEDISTFVNKMTWLIDNTQQVKQCHKDWFEAFHDAWCDR